MSPGFPEEQARRWDPRQSLVPSPALQTVNLSENHLPGCWHCPPAPISYMWLVDELEQEWGSENSATQSSSNEWRH